jgi:serine/threonine-protein kinase RsbW
MDNTSVIVRQALHDGRKLAVIDIDGESAFEFKQALDRFVQEGLRAVAVDLERMVVPDPKMIEQFVEVIERFQHDGIQLIFFNMTIPLKRLLRILNVTDIFAPVVLNEKEALALASGDKTARSVSPADQEQQIEMTVPVRKEFIPPLRDFVVNILRQAGFPQEFADDVELAFDEAVTNVMRHTFKYDPAKTFQIIIGLKNREMTLVLEDRGETFDPTAVPDIDMDAYIEQKRKGGLGVSLIKSLMDSVAHMSSHEGGNILSMTKKLR